jgi:hypothetical protein
MDGTATRQVVKSESTQPKLFTAEIAESAEKYPPTNPPPSSRPSRLRGKPSQQIRKPHITQQSLITIINPLIQLLLLPNLRVSIHTVATVDRSERTLSINQSWPRSFQPRLAVVFNGSLTNWIPAPAL